MPKTLFLSQKNSKKFQFLHGELIDDSLLVELLSWLQQSRRQCCLTLIDSSQKRRSVKLYLQQGEVAYVNSQNPHHRLGAILLRRGVIDEHQLHQVLSELNGQRLGRALVGRQLVSQQDLIEALRDQALIILHFALTTPKYFLEEDMDEALDSERFSRRFNQTASLSSSAPSRFTETSWLIPCSAIVTPYNLSIRAMVSR